MFSAEVRCTRRVELDTVEQASAPFRRQTLTTNAESEGVWELSKELFQQCAFSNARWTRENDWSLLIFQRRTRGCADGRGHVADGQAGSGREGAKSTRNAGTRGKAVTKSGNGCTQHLNDDLRAPRCERRRKKAKRGKSTPHGRFRLNTKRAPNFKIQCPHVIRGPAQHERPTGQQ